MPVSLEQMQVVALQLATQIVIHRKEDFPVSALRAETKEQQIMEHILGLFVAIMSTTRMTDGPQQFVPPGANA